MGIFKLNNRMVMEAATELIPHLPIVKGKRLNVYGVPRGGIPVAYALAAACSDIHVVDSIQNADIIVDDIVDSGATRDKYYELSGNKPFFALVDKLGRDRDLAREWIIFPWEETAEAGIEDNITRMMQYIGEDVKRGGLVETPKRVAKAWNHWFGGYKLNPADIMKVFTDGAESCDQMVIVKDIPFYSHCEHHIAPFFGTVTIAYIPEGRIVGLSKLSRLVDVFARRLQVQERLTNQIADAIVEHLKPRGVGVLIKARHMCMESRGICQQGHHTVTSALHGVLKTEAISRSEFMSLAGK